jgi:thiamine-phosphate diphosphorylase
VSVVRGLYGMVDVSASPGRSHRELLDGLLAARVAVVQLRMKGAADDEVEAMARTLLPACAAAGASLIVNDRWQVAARLPDVGVHLGQDDADPRAVREALGADRLIGLSTHTTAQVVAASRSGVVDYVGFGPVFSAAGKHLDPADRRRSMAAVGIAGLKEATAASSLPVVAIGGISLETLPWLVAAGADAVAVIAAVTAAADVVQAADAFQEAFAPMELQR